MTSSRVHLCGRSCLAAVKNVLCQWTNHIGLGMLIRWRAPSDVSVSYWAGRSISPRSNMNWLIFKWIHSGCFGKNTMAGKDRRSDTCFEAILIQPGDGGCARVVGWNRWWQWPDSGYVWKVELIGFPRTVDSERLSCGGETGHWVSSWLWRGVWILSWALCEATQEYKQMSSQSSILQRSLWKKGGKGEESGGFWGCGGHVNFF